MLVTVMVTFLRRTKEVDTRRDEASRLLLDAARDQERRAWSERDRAVEDCERSKDSLRQEIRELRERLRECEDALRERRG